MTETIYCVSNICFRWFLLLSVSPLSISPGVTGTGSDWKLTLPESPELQVRGKIPVVAAIIRGFPLPLKAFSLTSCYVTRTGSEREISPAETQRALDKVHKAHWYLMKNTHGFCMLYWQLIGDFTWLERIFSHFLLCHQDRRLREISLAEAQRALEKIHKAHWDLMKNTHDFCMFCWQ